MFTGPVGPVEAIFYWPEANFENFYWPGVSGSLLGSSPEVVAVQYIRLSLSLEPGTITLNILLV